ncbi:MAG: CotH kinase family protein, partial [Sedimentisphaerales bacterium]|nr:CotH kinase family protein [Sedimentisphaerales bacterium]
DGFQVNCGVRLRGGYSRSSSNPKHALRFFFRSMYGDAKLKYPLFGDEGTDEFDKIDLRTAANYSWHYDGTNGYLNTFTRDEWARLVQGKLGQPNTKGRYYHLYINGQYWGLYQTEERADARFAASYMGGVSDDYDVMKVDVAYNYHVLAAEGNNSNYRELYDAIIDGIDINEYFRLQGMNPDATVNSAYKRLLDVDNLIDYMLIDYYTADYDGPGSRFTYTNNFSAIINRTNPDGFKWMQHDSEHSFSVYSLNNSCRENMVTPLTTDGANFVYFNPHWLHEQLANNVIEYRLRFADRVHALLDNGGLLTQQKASALMASLADQIDMAIIAESARWGDSTSSTPRTKANWLDALQFTYNWINGTSSVLSTNGTLNARQDWPKYPREQRLKEQFRSVGWYSELESPVLSSYGGKVETDYQLTMSNPNGRGVMYYTTDGSDPRELSSDVNVNDTVLIAENASKYVLVPTANVLKPTGNVLAEVYNNIQGNDLASLTSSVNYPANPNYRELWPSLAMPAINHDENYGTRVRAILYPPTTGYYTFWITSDDNSSLRLSSDASPANAVEIAYLATWSNSNEWYKETSQQSEQIYLEYNRPYYLEALHKEGTGGDNLNIGWSGP